jgi:NAD(P)-dependent dehydrogenase (short-subunit alcohol dehydrogenase family)
LRTGTRGAQAKAAFEPAIASFGNLDVLVNNARYGYVGPIEDTPLAEFRAQIETNLFGVIIMTKAVLPYFRERKAGHIIQVTSIAGRIGPAGRAPYAAAKFGVEGFSESLSKEIGPLGIKVTIIEPGGFRTDFAGSSTQLIEGRLESMTARSVRPFASRKAITARSRGIRRRQRRCFLQVASLSSRPYGFCSGAILMQQTRRCPLAQTNPTRAAGRVHRLAGKQQQMSGTANQFRLKGYD